MKNRYSLTALSLYINYLIHGVGLIILAQNMEFLAKQWHTSTLTAAIVVSALGIGKLIAVTVSGKLSDIWGRKRSIILGMILYLVFFCGILISPNAQIAYLFGFLGGAANSFLDTGTYPALMEAFPRNAASATIIVKAFMQAGQFVLPFFIGFLIVHQLWYGYSFIVVAVVLLVNLLLISVCKFPASSALMEHRDRKQSGELTRKKYTFSSDELLLILFGAIAQILLYILNNWLAVYGTEVVHMSSDLGRKLVSYASIGAIVCVLVTFWFSKRGVSTSKIVIVYTFSSTVLSLLLWLIHQPVLTIVGSILLGYFSCGGLIQLGLTLLAFVSDRGKGLITSLYNISEAIAYFLIPFLVSFAAEKGAQNTFLINALFAFAGCIMVLVVYRRYKGKIKGI
ncbi:MFS transporter [Sporolactobacillus laevolacticus]|uniref:Transporter n=1 Tax=Sporolactobacillus laevolacticus DSM 442 TaxID=1395513 RepID=V6J1B9_9BACL|nr:MFS transporter [Sporolactobacillus laevolacticus]EST10559.1 transporter [Sporolactobacillus laevolacticus DSM 442]